MIPIDWKFKDLSACLEEVIDYRGKSTPKSGSGIPLITARNVKNGFLDFTEQEYMSMRDYNSWMTRGLPGEGDLLFTTEAPLGNVALFPHNGKKYAVAQRLVTLRPDKSVVDTRYLMYYFLSDFGKKEVKARATGSTAIGIRHSELTKIRVLLPPLPEQCKIADILTTWDHSIDLTTQLIVMKQKRKRGLIQQLLTGRRRFVESRGWSQYKIGDLFRNITRFEPWDDEKTYIQAIVRRWSQGIEVRPPLLGKQIKTKNLQTIRAGDFLISDIQASYGAMSMVHDQQDGLYVSNVYTILVPRDEHQIHTSYFDQLSRTSLMRHLVVQSSNGFKAERIRLSLVLDAFMQQKVYLPDDITEQRRIADLLQWCDDEIMILDRKLTLLKRQKQGLIKQLLTGKIRVLT